MSDQPITYNNFNNKFFFLNSLSNYDAKVFIDEDTYRKFKDFRKYDRTTKQLQQQGFVLPILKTNFHRGLFSSNVMEVSKCRPQESGEFSDSNWHDYCKVKLVHKSPYRRYEFQMKRQTVVLVHHKKYPFADFEFNGVRYRWIKYSNVSFLKENEYRFDLYELPMEKPSLMSNQRKGQANEKSVLMENFLGNFWFKSVKEKNLEDLTTTRRIGRYDSTERTLLGVKKGQFEVNTSMEINNIKDIPDDIMLFLMMITMFKAEEEVKETNQKSRNVANNQFSGAFA